MKSNCTILMFDGSYALWMMRSDLSWFRMKQGMWVTLPQWSLTTKQAGVW